MTLADFHADIKAAISRGDSVDGRIPGLVAEAANLIELAYSWQYMSKTATTPVVLGQSWVAADPFLKSFKTEPMLANSLGERRDLPKISSTEVVIVDEAEPQGFYYEDDKLNFDSYVGLGSTTTYSVQYQYWAFTDWPTDTTLTPKLLIRGRPLLKAQTMLLYATEFRDTRMIEAWTVRKTEAFQAMMLAEEEEKASGTGVQAMRYVR